MAVSDVVSAEPSNAATASQSRVDLAENEEERLNRLARAHNLPPPVLKITDLPDDSEPVNLPEVNRLLDFFDRRLALLSDGTLLMTDSLLDEPGLSQSCRAALRSIRGISNIHILAARTSVVRMVLDQGNAVEFPVVETGRDVVGAITDQQQTLQSLIESALVQEASDIHLFVRPAQARVVFRIFGSLVEHDVWAREAGDEITNLIFNDASDAVTGNLNKNIPMDASMNVVVQQRARYARVRCRVALMPELRGYDVTIRLLSSNEDVPPLSSLGFSEEQLSLLTRAARLPHGTIIIAGPTGSGKTSTLASMLTLVPDNLKIITVEDPPEKLVPGASQTPVNDNNENLSFARLGRATLRHDPDVIMIGEIRDGATAEAIVQAATTGHLVMSTLHTNSATSIVTRLIDLKVTPLRLADPNLLKLLVFQRLTPVLCKNCRLQLDAREARQAHGAKTIERLRRHFADAPGIRLRNGSGCASCRDGVVGRTVVAELIWVNNEDRAYIQQADNLGWHQHLLKRGWQPIEEHAESKVREGLVCPLDAERVLSYLFGEER